jgi:heat shock protein HtpX
MNSLKVFILLAGLTALFGAVGGAVGGTSGAVLALGLAAVMNVVMYFGSASMVLRSYRAQVVDHAQAPELYAMVDRLRQRAGLPMPVVAIAPHAQPNAFATGRSPAHSVVCVTEGLLRVLNRAELEGVIAHELAHIKNRDMLLMTLAATIAGAVANLAQFGFLLGGRDDDGESNPVAGLAMMILGPLAAMLLQSAISRTREFKADAVGAEIAGSPEGLASALQALERASKRTPMQVAPAAASLAIVNPLAAFSGQAMVRLFSTHPPTEARVDALVGAR